jgi:hypothetical protein
MGLQIDVEEASLRILQIICLLCVPSSPWNSTFLLMDDRKAGDHAVQPKPHGCSKMSQKLHRTTKSMLKSYNKGI